MATNIKPAKFPIGNDSILDPKLSHYCAPKHWDPTMVYRYSVPQGSSIALPMDPRPWTRICLQYVNSGPAEQAPSVPASMVFPGAGEFYPPNRYLSAIDEESKLRRLDRGLNRDLLPPLPNQKSCFPEQYVLPETSDAYQQYSLLPPQVPPKSRMVRELQEPRVLEHLGQYQCSEEAMICNLRGANRFFNNVTKMDKYRQKDDKCGNLLWQTKGGNNPSAENLPRPAPSS